MDKLREIIDKYTDGNYLISESDKEKMSEDILNLFDVSERYLLIEWLNGKPIIDGSIYFDSKNDCLEHWQKLPKIDGFDVTHTICRITNVR